MAFTGFPIEGVHFYQDLEEENTKEFWAEHKATYDEAVRAPMEALVRELGEFGTAKVFRPHRDVRFSTDKSPYKTHQGAVVGVFDGTGWYVALGPEGLHAGGGTYSMQPGQLAAYRRAIDTELPAKRLEKVLGALDGFDLGGDALKTAPRGFSKDHPRIDLLRRRQLTAMREFGTPDWLGTAAVVDHVREAWAALRPLMEWVERHVGPPEEGRRRWGSGA